MGLLVHFDFHISSRCLGLLGQEVRGWGGCEDGGKIRDPSVGSQGGKNVNIAGTVFFLHLGPLWSLLFFVFFCSSS